MKRLLISILLMLGLPQICLGAAATMYVTPAGAGAKDGAAWASAMGYAEWETDMEASTEAGDIYYVAGGQYTLTSDFTVANDGTAANPIQIIGVTSGTSAQPPTVADWATGDNRPLITDAGNNYTFEFDDYIVIRNIRIVSSDSNSTRADTGSVFENCKATNGSGTAGRIAFNSNGTASRVINCEAISTAGIGIQLGQAVGTALYNYIHDSSTGVVAGYNPGIIAFNIIDTMSTCGIACTASRDQQIILNNTLYNCLTGISGADTENDTIVHNIFNDCTTVGVTFSAEAKSNFVEWNNWEGNTGGDTTNLTKGVYDKAVDPEFTDAAGGDFSLLSTSDLLNAGVDLLGSTQ